MQKQRSGFQTAACALVAFATMACSSNSAADVSSLMPTRTPAPRAAAPAETAAPTEVSPTADIAVATKTPARAPASTSSMDSSTQAAQFPALNLETCVNTSLALNDKAPTVRRSAGQIVYLTGEGNIELTDAAGRRSTKVTSDAFVSEERGQARVYQFPTFSNDGRSLAFVGLELAEQGKSLTQTVYVADAVANAPLTDLYTTHEDNIPYLDWSPDGASVAFLTIRSGTGEIRVASRKGGAVSVLDSGSSAYWHWRNDSTAMVAHLSGRFSPSEGDAHISVIDAIANSGAQKNVNRITAPPGRFQSPHYSPNGEFMLYSVASGAQSEDLVLADKAGKPICSVTSVDAGAYFAWSPGGRRLAIMDSVSAVQQPMPLMIYDLATGKHTQIDRSVIAFFWSPDGKKVALYSIVSNVDPTALGLSHSKLNRPESQSEGNVALRIEIVDAESGAIVKVADTLPSRQFAQLFQFFDQYSRAVTPWSPDSRNLVFVTFNRDKEASEVGVATLSRKGDAVSLKRVASGTLAFWSPN